MKRILLNLLLVAALAVQAQNPYLPLWEHVPDGEPRVFEDPDAPGRYRVYIIGSHDVFGTQYCGIDVHAWSAPVEDLSDWRDEGALFTFFADGKWDTMYAPDLVEKVNGDGKKEYYLYPHSRTWGRVAMVAKSDRPDGPFVAINLNKAGTRCLDGAMVDFDPAALVDTDGRVYAYWGFQHSVAAELDAETMWAVRPGTKVQDPFLTDEFRFYEASSMRKVGNKYVMIYSGYSGEEYGLFRSNSTLRYVYSDSPMGPWQSGDVLVDSRGVVPSEDGSRLTTTNFGHNTHGSILEINGQWYVFYHRPTRNFGYSRQAMVAPIKVTWDKKPVAKGGRVTITGYNPFAGNKEWQAKAENGDCYPGAEVTSEGFQIYGLDPHCYYSAGYVCAISAQDAMQDQRDVWDNSMDCIHLQHGAVLGYKYFGFGGLAKESKGCKAYAGCAKGDGTQLHVDLTAETDAEFRIRVMSFDSRSTLQHAEEIAVIAVPAGSKDRRIMLHAAVPAVEGKKGKQAVYLRLEGNGAQGNLMTLHGISFSKKGASVPCAERVPQVTIAVDGQAQAIPAQALLATNENGYTQTDHYDISAPMLTAESRIEATADSEEVAIVVSEISEGRATVRATYRGVTKTYLLHP